MEIQEYISQQISISDKIFDFISADNKSESENEFQSLIELIKSYGFDKDRDNFRNFLKLLSIISMNHHRTPEFFEKFEKILLHYSANMKQTFSNDEIFDFFKTNKRILSFLFQKQIITPNLNIVHCLKEDIYFYPEIKDILESHIQHSFTDEQKANILKFQRDQVDFNTKRTKGENDGQLCEMIRRDSVEDFITYVNQTNLSLQKTLIEPSIFETNPFLIDKTPTLIEYATFYGSIQIFQYMRLSHVTLTPSLWLYAIHGENGDIIHFLEEDKIEPPSENYESCFVESIKCHHNDIAKYILNNKMDEKEIEYKSENSFRENIYYYCLKYHNFQLLPENLDKNFVFLHLCEFYYFNLVKLFLQNKNIDINYIVVSTSF